MPEPRLEGYWPDEAHYQGATEAADIAFTLRVYAHGGYGGVSYRLCK